MRKLNKIIKKHTTNKQRRKKKNMEVFCFLENIIGHIKNNNELNIQKMKFIKIKRIVFLEKYFEDEMRENDVDIVDYLYNYFNFDLFELSTEKIIQMYSELTHPDEFSRNRINLISLRIPEINKILSEYNGEKDESSLYC